MSAVGIVLTTACASCRESFPVNALAPAARCPRCGHTVAVDVATWKKVLEAPAIDGHRAEPGREHVESITGSIGFVRNYVRKDAACARCGGEIPLPKSLAHANRGWCICVHCGDKVSVRALPQEFGGMGSVTHVIGEDFGAITGLAPAPVTAPSQGEIVGCPQCGSGVPVNGQTRAVPCRHCNAQVVLPDAVWAKLHPLPAQRTFYLWFDPAKVPAATGKMDLDWSSLEDVVADFHGNLYFLGERKRDGWINDQLAVWSTDSQLNLRWVRDPLQIEGKTDDPKLAFSPSGHLLLRAERRHSVVVLSCADGSTAATIGGKEPDGAQAHHLDLEYCDSHAVDVDGTILALVHDRLLRWTHDGRPIETWPPTKGVFGGEKHQKMKPLFRKGEGGERERVKADAEYPPDVKALKHRPTEIDSDYVEMNVGWDGFLYFMRSRQAARLDRNGAVVFSGELLNEHSNDEGRPCADRNGFSYWLRDLPHSRRAVFRISPDGKDVRMLVDGSQRGTPITDCRHIAVLPDGTIYLFDYGGHARIFGADGTLRFASEKAREEDADADRKIARDEL